jgi:quercetin dioxygenase-like cupin family protein
MVLLMILATYVLVAFAPRNASADNGVTVEPLTPVTFPGQVDARFRVKRESGVTQVVQARELDHVLNATITFEPGGEVPWHTHPGPVVTVQQGR